MSIVYAAAVAALMGVGIYLLLSRHVVRMMLGTMLLGAAVNLVILLAGRAGPLPPPVIAETETVLQTGSANPLPQALILTAIVIGFSLVAFVASLALKTFRTSGTVDMRNLTQAEDLGSPYEDGPKA